ncbi:MAG: hypothetical protein AAF628_03130 [Planctomycetota bacterium]
MKTTPSIALLGLFGLLGCDTDAPEPAPPHTASAEVEPSPDESEVRPAPVHWIHAISLDAHDWVQTVNGLNMNVPMGPDTHTRPAAAVYLQAEDGTELDEATLRAQLEKKRLTVVQLLTPAETGVKGGYLLECAAFT